jgi:hypothetical protein
MLSDATTSQGPKTELPKAHLTICITLEGLTSCKLNKAKYT